jgi:protein-glutamine gamma-glutamyltransferase
VVLLRSVGIPARLVTGFGYGTPIGDGSRLYRASDAHAWVEVWYPGVGWSDSDPTAGATPTSQTDQLGFIGAFAHDLLSGDFRVEIGLALLGIGLIVVGIGRLIVRRRRNRRGRPGVNTEPASPLRAAFVRLEAALAAVGSPRAPGESVANVSRRLAARGQPPGLATVAALHRDLYAPTAPSTDESRSAADELDRISTRLLADAAAGPPAGDRGR